MAFSPSVTSGLIRLYIPHDMGFGADASMTSLIDATATYDGVQATSGKRGVFRTGIQGGKGALELDGTDDEYGLGNLSALTEGEIFIILKTNANTHQGIWATANDQWYAFGGNSLYEDWGRSSRIDGITLSKYIASDYLLYNVSSKSGEHKIRQDTIEQNSTATNTVSFQSTFTLGKNGLSGYYLGAKILAIAVYNRVVSGAERTSIVDDFKNYFEMVNLGFPRQIQPATGSFIFTGQSINMNLMRQIQAAAGSFAMTGKDINFFFSKALVAAAGSFALTGKDINFLYNKVIQPTAGSFSFLGKDANLAYSRIMSADPGAFTFTGKDINFFFSKSLVTDPGAFALTGKDINFLYSRVMGTDPGAFALTGKDINFLYSRVMGVNPGVFAFTGNDVNFLFGKSMSVDKGTFLLTGQDVNLLYSKVIQPAAGSFSFLGKDANLLYSRIMPVDKGDFVVTGKDANFTLSKSLSAAAGSFIVTGKTIELNVIIAPVADFSFSGLNLDGNLEASDVLGIVDASLGTSRAYSYSITNSQYTNQVIGTTSAPNPNAYLRMGNNTITQAIVNAAGIKTKSIVVRVVAKTIIVNSPTTQYSFSGLTLGVVLSGKVRAVNENTIKSGYSNSDDVTIL